MYIEGLQRTDVALLNLLAVVLHLQLMLLWSKSDAQATSLVPSFMFSVSLVGQEANNRTLAISEIRFD